MSQVASLPVKTGFDIRAMQLSADVLDYFPIRWEGTALDVLRTRECPPEGRLWVALNEEWIDARTLRLFAIRCARLALALTPFPSPDKRSVAACAVAERFANGEATPDELTAAWEAARCVNWEENWPQIASAADAAMLAAEQMPHFAFGALQAYLDAVEASTRAINWMQSACDSARFGAAHEQVGCLAEMLEAVREETRVMV